VGGWREGVDVEEAIVDVEGGAVEKVLGFTSRSLFASLVSRYMAVTA
jgi:hypothetical protein